MSKKEKKTNLIWIMADQLRADMLGCNKDPNVHTPNIDALAGEGVNFCRAVSTYTLCCPARGTMLTGIYPNRCTLGHEYRHRGFLFVSVKLGGRPGLLLLPPELLQVLQGHRPVR